MQPSLRCGAARNSPVRRGQQAFEVGKDVGGSRFVEGRNRGLRRQLRQRGTGGFVHAPRPVVFDPDAGKII